MKVRIDRQACVGNARCHAAAPEVYELDDDGYAIDGSREVAPDLEAAARRGARACPERAIEIDLE